MTFKQVVTPESVKIVSSAAILDHLFSIDGIFSPMMVQDLTNAGLQPPLTGLNDEQRQRLARLLEVHY